MNQTELKRLLQQSIERKQKAIESLTSGTSNPQVIELRKRAQWEKEAFQSVLSALNGDSVLLKIHATE